MTTKVLPDLRFIPISQIKIGDRHRKDLGDLDSLAASMETGLLQPIGVTPDMELIWGLRRLVATRDKLKWEMIWSRIVPVASIVQGEIEENMLRKDFTPTEMVAIVETLRGYSHGGDRKSDQDRKCDVDRLTTKEAAERVGFCRDDYYRAKKVVEKGIPELVEALDSGRLSISAASELAGSHPDAQRRVLATVKDENGWVVLGVRKKLSKAKRQMEIERTEGRQVEPPNGDIRLYHCPFQQLEADAGIEPNSVNLILTDHPFGKDFLRQVSELGAFAARVLVEGGLLVTYSGQYYLDKVMRALGEHLAYRWIKESPIGNDANLVHPYQILSFWKPILIYSKGAWQERRQWHDVCRVAGKDKDWHDWQQPLEEVERLIQDFSDPGDLLVDPCGGGFTVAAACKNLGRRCISCDINEGAVIRGQDRLAGKEPGLVG